MHFCWVDSTWNWFLICIFVIPEWTGLLQRGQCGNRHGWHFVISGTSQRSTSECIYSHGKEPECSHRIRLSASSRQWKGRMCSHYYTLFTNTYIDFVELLSKFVDLCIYKRWLYWVTFLSDFENWEWKHEWLEDYSGNLMYRHQIQQYHCTPVCVLMHKN